MEQLEKMCDNDFHVDEGLAAEILVRLPGKSVLRFRAVCREWLRITSCTSFLAKHARRRPLEVLLYTPTTAVVPDDVVGQELLKLEAVAVSGGGPRRLPVARYPAMAEYPNNGWKQYCRLLASCDGLLLFGVGYAADGGPEQYLVCNPTTRQWSDLPRLSCDDDRQQRRESGFYFHETSGEYRLLYYVAFWVSSGQASYYGVLSAGADAPRKLSMQATPIEHTVAFLKVKDHEYGNLHSSLMTPAVLHGHLHWLQHMEAGRTGQMVTFDTVAETFRRMPPPPVTWKQHSNLIVADGSLMACERGYLFVDLWVLQGYAGAPTTGEERWEKRHRLEVPWKDDMLVAAGDDGGDVVVGTRSGMVAYNVRSGTVRHVGGLGASRDDTIAPSRHVFRESLVRHSFFDARPHSGLPLFRFCA